MVSSGMKKLFRNLNINIMFSNMRYEKYLPIDQCFVMLKRDYCPVKAELSYEIEI